MSWLARRRFELVALAIALVTAVVHLTTTEFHVVGSGKRPSLIERAVQVAEGRLWDLKFRVRGERPPNPDVVVVAIDEKSSSAWGLWPWSRRHMARALEKLAEANVAAVGMDATFVDARTEDIADARATLDKVKALPPSPAVDEWRASLEAAVAAGQDDALERALQKLGPKLVQGIIPIDASSLGDFEPGQLEGFERAMEPFVVRESRVGGVTRAYAVDKSGLYVFEALQAPLARFLGAGTALGHFAAIIDIDGVIRRAGLLVRVKRGEAFFPSMSLQTAAVALGAQLKPVLKGAEVLGVELTGPGPRTRTPTSAS